MKIIKNEQNDKLYCFTISFDKNEWVDFNKKALARLAVQISIPGFRKGKVPPNIAKNKIDKGSIYREAITIAYPAIVDFVIKSPQYDKANCLDTIAKHEVIKVDDESLEVICSFEMFPKIEKVDLDGLEFEQFNEKEICSTKAIDATIESWLLPYSKRTEVTNRAIKDGDYVLIDYVGTIDGKEFPGGSANNYNLKIGSQQFIDNFEQQLIGKKINDVVTVNVKFPKDYHVKDYANKPATFKVTIKKISTVELPKIDKDFIEKNLHIVDVKNIEELRKYIHDFLLFRAKQEYIDQATKKINEKILSSIKLDYVPEMLQKKYETNLINRYQNEAKEKNLSLEQYCKQFNISPQQFQHFIKTQARDNILISFAYEEFATKFNVDVTDKDFNDFMKRFSRYFISKNTDKSVIESKGYHDYLESLILRNMLIEKITAKYSKKK